MKNYIGFIAVFLLFFCFIFLSSAENCFSQCSTPPCYDDPALCQQWSAWQQEDYITTSVPGFEGCAFEITYCFRQCDLPASPQTVEICCLQFNTYWNWPCNCKCDSFANWINSGSSYDQARKLIDFKLKLFQLICDQKWSEYVTYLTQKGLLSLVNCNPGPPSFFVYFKQGYCQAFCIVQDPIGKPAGIYIKPVDCSTDYCCSWEYSYCIDNNTGQTVKTLTKSSSGAPDCMAIPPNLSWCDDGFDRRITTCINTCEQP